jgi:hypothetical protein
MAKSDLKSAHDTLTRRVIDLEGVSGTAIGTEGGRPCLKVYLSSGKTGARSRIPGKVGGFRVVLEETGTFRRL